jgi:hypothetical protein
MGSSSPKRSKVLKTASKKMPPSMFGASRLSTYGGFHPEAFVGETLDMNLMAQLRGDVILRGLMNDFDAGLVVDEDLAKFLASLRRMGLL